MTSEGAAGPRLLVYSQDGLGLGHLRRTTLLVSEFLAALPNASALTISDSPLGQFFKSAPGHDYLKLPSIHKAAPGHWNAVSLVLPVADVFAMRREIIRSVALNYRPDVVLVDHMPHGAMGELVPTLEALAPLPVRMMLGLRDILDAPEVVRDRWELEGAFDAVEQHYHEVLVYGSQDVFDVAAQYSWPATISKRLRYCGYVTAADRGSPSGALRTRYLRRQPNGDLVVAIAGSGADGYRLFDALLDAVPGLVAQRPCSIVIVTGPMLPAPDGLDLMRRARGLPVHVLRSVSDTRSYLRAADLVVAMAGYNTSVESLGAARRALLVPRHGPSAEQQMRARLFAERGWVGWLPPAQLSPETLQQAMIEALTKPATAPLTAPDLNGRAEAVRYLNAAVERRSPVPSAELVPAGDRTRGAPHLIET